MFAKVLKKFEVALNGGLAGTRKYWPGDVAEGRHAEIGVEMGRAEEIDEQENNIPNAPESASEEDDLTAEELGKMRTHAELDEVFSANELTIEGFADMTVADKKAALISEFWPDAGEKGTTPPENKASTPPENKSV